MDTEKLLDRIDDLEDRLFALTGVVYALICSLDDAGIPLRERMCRHTARAANELEEERRLPEAATRLDELRDVIDALLKPYQANSGGNTSGS
jgi:hypothetical protein